MVKGRLGGISCSVVEGGEAIGRKELIFISSGIGRVYAFEEEVKVPMPMYDHALKVVERGRFGGEAVLPEVMVMLKFLDAILARRKGFADIDGGGVVFDE